MKIRQSLDKRQEYTIEMLPQAATRASGAIGRRQVNPGWDQPTRDLLVVNSQLPPINLGAQTPDTLQIWTDCGIRFACFCPKKKNTALNFI